MSLLPYLLPSVPWRCRVVSSLSVGVVRPHLASLQFIHDSFPAALPREETIIDLDVLVSTCEELRDPAAVADSNDGRGSGRIAGQKKGVSTKRNARTVLDEAHVGNDVDVRR